MATAPKPETKQVTHPARPRSELPDAVETYKRIAARYPKVMAKLAE